MTLDEVIARLREECDKLGSQAAWAREHKLSAVYVNDVLNRRRPLGDAILKAIKVRKVITYEDMRKKG